jgi:hypothetical protein
VRAGICTFDQTDRDSGDIGAAVQLRVVCQFCGGVWGVFGGDDGNEGQSSEQWMNEDLRRSLIVAYSTLDINDALTIRFRCAQ